MASLSDLSDSFKQLGIEQGDNVIVHSSLFSLGKIEEFAVNALPQAFLAGLELALGNSGSVFVPTFNYDFPKSRVADLRIQPTPSAHFLSGLGANLAFTALAIRCFLFAAKAQVPMQYAKVINLSSAHLDSAQRLTDSLKTRLFYYYKALDLGLPRLWSKSRPCSM